MFVYVCCECVCGVCVVNCHIPRVCGMCGWRVLVFTWEVVGKQRKQRLA